MKMHDALAARGSRGRRRRRGVRSLPPRRSIARGRRGRLLLVLLASILGHGCGGSEELTIQVRDMEGEWVSGVRIQQVGSGKHLGETDATGKTAIRPERGEGTVKIRLSRSAEDGVVYSFQSSYTITEDDFRLKYKLISVPAAKGMARGGGATGTLKIRTTPEGAEVLIDGRSYGRTPREIADLPADSVLTVELRKEGWQPATQRIYLLPGQEYEFPIELRPLEARTADLEVRSQPSGAAIYLDGRSTGRTTPATFTGLEPGAHRVRVRLPGHGEDEREVNLKPGMTWKVDLELLPASEPGAPAKPTPRAEFSKTYTVSTAPFFAEVYLDGSPQNLNLAGRFKVTLVGGPHRFRVINKAAGVDRTLTYHVQPGDPHDGLILDLQQGIVRFPD